MNKMYYSISEVAKMLGVTTATLRFWEKEFKQLKPKVSNGGTRRYVQKDIDILRSIHRLLKEKKMTIDGARNILLEGEEREVTVASVLFKLESVRKELLAIRRELNYTGVMKEDTVVD